jgi:hypothetical protein
MWSSKNRTPYLAMTAHWMCKDNAGHLQLRSALVAFHRVWGPHTAKNLSSVILWLLDRAEVTANISLLFFFVHLY